MHMLEKWQGECIALASAGSDGDGAHDLSHLHRVWHNAQVLLAAHEDADPLVVMAACYLHDLVNLPKNDPQRQTASQQSARLARKHMAARGFPAERLSNLYHAIESHSFSAGVKAETIEAKIVQDADRLDALGAVGLARLFYIGGQMATQLAHPTDPLAMSREFDDRRYALDHIVVKLARLPGMMQTALGRTLGEARLAELTSFRTRFASEWTGA
ncbi:MAG: HD domain-containing protein [Pseudomonadota bacterium]